MMKKYFLQTAALIALLCGAASCSNDDDNKNGPVTPPSDGKTTYAECNYYGDITNATKFILTISTCPVDSNGNPTGAGSKYFFEIYSSKVTAQQPAAGAYQFDAQSAKAPGSFASNASYMIPVTVKNGAPSLGQKVNFKAGSITVSVDGSNIKVEGSATLTTGTEIAISATNFKFADKSGGVEPPVDDEYTGLLKENVDMGKSTNGAAGYFGRLYSEDYDTFTVMFASADQTKMIFAQVIGDSHVKEFKNVVIPVGTFPITGKPDKNVAIPAFTDTENTLYGSYYVDDTDSAKPIFGFADSGSVTISKSGNNYTVTVVYMTAEGFEIKSSYTGAPKMENLAYQTSLPGDYALSLAHITGATAAYMGSVPDPNVGNWVLSFDGEVPAKDFLNIQILTQSPAYTTSFPTGTYKAAKDKIEANVFLPGYYEEAEDGMLNIYGSWGAQMNDKNQLTTFIPVQGGTIKVEDATDGKLTFTFNILDDNDNNVTGTWTGKVTTSEGRPKAAKTNSATKMSFSKQFGSSYTVDSKFDFQTKRTVNVQGSLNNKFSLNK